MVGSLIDLEVEAIVNPANSEGLMEDGVAGVIKKKGGKGIEEEAMQQAPIPIGKAIITSAGKLKCEYVIHAPTMKVPLQKTSAESIAKAVQAVFKIARELDIKNLAFPGMGTGAGKVPLEVAASAMLDVIRKQMVIKNSLAEVILIDKNEEMVKTWETVWNQEKVVDKEITEGEDDVNSTD